MKRLHVTTVVVAAALVAAASVSASPKLDAPQTITLVSVQKGFATAPQIDKQHPPHVGGQMIFNDLLYNHGRQFGKPAGAQVGTADNVCTIVSQTHLQCTLIAKVPNGRLVVTGTVSMGSKTTQFAITGGTGAYAAAHGSATGRDVSKTRTIVTLHLAS